MPFAVPIVLLVFNRPDLTQKVFDSVKKEKPKKLYIVADGPRPKVPSDKKACESTRDIFKSIDWPCEIQLNYAETNLGLAKRVSSGLDWVFENEDVAIILEDDCVPEPSFFPYCQELLEKYKDDERVMTIVGTNFQKGRQNTPYSYYFSRHTHIWGWATWKRAWSMYDHDMETWEELKDSRWLEGYLGNALAVRYWTNIFEKTIKGEINSWAYRWTYANWVHGGSTIIPNCNLIKNIGSDDRATHTRGRTSLSDPVGKLEFPLSHPPHFVFNYEADNRTEKERFSGKSLFSHKLKRWQNRIKHKIATFN